MIERETKKPSGKPEHLIESELINEIKHNLWLLDHALEGKDGAGIPLGDYRANQWLATGVTEVNKIIAFIKDHSIKLDPTFTSSAEQKIGPHLEKAAKFRRENYTYS